MDSLRDLKRRAILHPEDAEALHALAEALLAAGDVAEARLQAEKALARHPVHGNLLRLAVACLRREGRLARARELLEAAVDALPADASLRDDLADVLEEEGRPDDALVQRVHANARAPGDERRVLAVAEGYARRGLARRALEVLALQRDEGAGRLAAELRARFPDVDRELIDRAAAALPPGPSALADAAARLTAGDLAGARRALARAGAPERATQPYALLRAGLLRREGREAEAALALLRAGVSDPVVGGPVPLHAAVGQIGALGWAPGSGCVSPVQAVAVAGPGRLVFSGNVGASGREAGEVAWTCLRAMAEPLGFGAELRGKDLHLHFADTELAKDGPSAGLALWLAGASALAARPLRGRLAATGELTLHGAVRGVGGLHEKCTAAVLAGVQHLVAPRLNRPEVERLPRAIREVLQVSYVDDPAQALDAAAAPRHPRPGDT